MNDTVVGSALQSDLIYDLGMHTALDTKYYLDKGFRVVALEANPKLVEDGRAKLAGAIAAGKLHIVDRALWSGDEHEVTFYVNDKKDDWSSVLEGNANRERTGVQEIRVQTVQLKALFAEYGLPYYLKCDIEGADEVLVDQLIDQKLRPSYVSVEVAGQSGVRVLAKLFVAGYHRMQMVNQAFNAWTKPPSPALEGSFVDVRFSGHMSGLFGKELPKEKWTSYEQTSENYLNFLSLKARDAGLAHGWVDVHAQSSGGGSYKA